MQHTLAVMRISEEVHSPAAATFVAQSQLHVHGAPYVLLVRRDGTIYRSDRRRGWRELLALMDPCPGDRLPRRLARLIAEYASAPPAGEATLAFVSDTVVMSVMGFEGGDELFVCSLWRYERQEPIEGARSRYSLTKREVQLLERILRGESSNEIARILSLATSTVEWHTKRLLVKTKSQNRTQLASRVLGWLPDMN